MPQKPVKRTMKNVIKNLVKQNQRLNDYKSPFGVKFWNMILKDTKIIDTKKRKKVRKENVMAAIEKDVTYWTRCINDEKLTDKEKEKFKIYMELIKPFLCNDWKFLLDDETAHPKKWIEKEWFNERIGAKQIYYVFIKPDEKDIIKNSSGGNKE